MDYKEVIRSKNNILSIALLASVVLRGIVNGVFMGIQTVIGLVLAGLVITIILLLISKKLNPIIMMYLMVAVLTGISIACMVAFPTTTNYLMFFLAIFMIVLYEDIRPISIQCVASAVCMFVFYFKYTEELANTWSLDAMAMCIVYIISGMFVFWALCKLTQNQFKNLQQFNAESNTAREKVEGLLLEIGKSIKILGNTSDRMNESIMVTEKISGQIALATEDVEKRALEEVMATEVIRTMMEDGVSQMQEVAGASKIMAEASNATNKGVYVGEDMVHALNTQMSQLEGKMGSIASSITELSAENERIVQILRTLDEITSQTNLLSLNATIEAARAGEHGKGFTVVASEIRNLSENSAKFTDQIHTILDGIQEKTNTVKSEIESGRDFVTECTAHVERVDGSFQNIWDNTSKVLSQAREVEKGSRNLENLLNKTLNHINHINENVESTSSAVEEISASIVDMNTNIATVVNGYNDINEITNSLARVSRG